MPNIQVKLRRGTATEHNTFAGAEGEVTVDTTNDTLRVHDGSTAGGIRLAKLSEVSGGTGTVTSVGSGTGLTGGPITTSGTLSIADNGVTFAKMQDINTAKVIGRTTAGSGDPEEVSILDEDAMTSNSATALATQQSIKAYVDAQVSSVSSFESSDITWTAGTSGTNPAQNNDITVSHGLGGVPDNFSVALKCTTAENGWSIGEEASIDYESSSNGRLSIWSTSTVVGFRFNSGTTGNPFELPVRTAGSGSTFNPNASNWKLVFRAQIFS